MSPRLAIVVILVVAGCGSSVNEASTKRGGRASAEAASRVERCVDRLMERVKPEDFAKTTRAVMGRHVERAYCAPFEKRGWVYDDGALSIRAHVVEQPGTCSSSLGGETRTVSCEELQRMDERLVLDCALLHIVRRSEVRKYIEELQRNHEVSCDDGTPLDELGAR
jgi:hypothetical protein